MATKPAIKTTSLEGYKKTTFRETLTATGDTPITWSITSGTLPKGLSLSSAGVISGTPTQTGSYNNITFRALNSVGDDVKVIPVVINDIVAPNITTSSLANGKAGTAYSATLVATGQPAPTWSISSGTLPTGLSLSSAGVISGTPTAAGTFTFTVKATNAAGNATKQLSITITATPPSITTASLAAATAGTAYSATLAASGTTPITWSLASGKLPPGLTLSSGGVISGTVPSVKGTYNAEATVETNWGTDTKAITIIVE